MSPARPADFSWTFPDIFLPVASFGGLRGPPDARRLSAGPLAAAGSTVRPAAQCGLRGLPSSSSVAAFARARLRRFGAAPVFTTSRLQW
jgi:hypothetical protein